METLATITIVKTWSAKNGDREWQFKSDLRTERPTSGTWEIGANGVGKTFLDWLAAPSGIEWIDVGCGNGAFTELVVERCAPATVHGVDPSDAQLAFARQRPAARLAKFGRGDAMALPFPEQSFDVAIMALVIFFVPDPAKGVAEMVRVVRPGGIVAAYAWDILGGGFTLEPLRIELRSMGVKPVDPPSVEASRMEVMRDLWIKAGLAAIETRRITVHRTFRDFEEFWSITLSAPSLGSTLASMSRGDVDLLKTRMRARLPPDVAGRIIYEAHANAVKGLVSA